MITANHNTGEEIRFAFGKFSLGMALVAATDKGIAAILLGDSRDELRRELVYAFPQAHLVADETGLADKTAKIVAFLDAPNQGLDLPLDIRGSAQEQAVWQALCNVPAGQTTTYGQIAKSLALPATARMWVRLALPMCWPSPFPATGWSRPMVRFRVTAGGFSASGN